MEFILLNIRPQVATLLFESSRFVCVLSGLQVKDDFRKRRCVSWQTAGRFSQRLPAVPNRRQSSHLHTGTSITCPGYGGTLPARRSEPYSWDYRYKRPPGRCFQVLKEPLTEVPPLFQAQDTGCSAQYTGTRASVSSCVKWDVRCVNRSLKGFFQRHSSLRSIQKPCHKLWPREPPILNFIYTLLNYFMNRALCSMPGILPCASFSLYKPLGLALICVPRVPSLKTYIPGKEKEKSKHKASSLV